MRFVPCTDFDAQDSSLNPWLRLHFNVRSYKIGQDVTVLAYAGINMAGSPCSTSGAVGGRSSVGPMVPALVQ